MAREAGPAGRTNTVLQTCFFPISGVMPKGSGYAEMEAAFNKGEVAMMITGPWAWDNICLLYTSRCV